MEKRKPAGRPFAKYEKPQRRNLKSQGSSDSPADAYDKLTRPGGKIRKPAGKDSGKPEKTRKKGKNTITTSLPALLKSKRYMASLTGEKSRKTSIGYIAPSRPSTRPDELCVGGRCWTRQTKYVEKTELGYTQAA